MPKPPFHGLMKPRPAHSLEPTPHTSATLTAQVMRLAEWGRPASAAKVSNEALRCQWPGTRLNRTRAEGYLALRAKEFIKYEPAYRRHRE